MREGSETEIYQMIYPIIYISKLDKNLPNDRVSPESAMA